MIKAASASVGSSGRIFVCVALAAMLSAMSGVASIHAADIDPADCEKNNMRAESVKACANLVSSSTLEPQERSRIFASRGDAWLKEEEPIAAIADYARALDIDAQNVTALRGRALALSLLGRHELAVGDWTQLAKLQPEASEIYCRRGEAWLAARDGDRALADYDYAIELNPNDTEAFIGRAAVHEFMQNRKLALLDLDRAQQANPESFLPYLARAEAAERWGDKAMAVDNYRLVLKFNRFYWNAYKALNRLGVVRGEK